MRPAVTIDTEGTVRALPRVKPGSAVVHLLNYEYDATRDTVKPLGPVRVRVDLRPLGLAEARTCRWLEPGVNPTPLAMRDGGVVVPSLGLWGMLLIEGPAAGASKP